MSVRLHVGNLDWNASSDDLYHLFAAHGQVLHAQVMVDHDRGLSRGFGFVEMADKGEARQVLAALHGQTFRGRVLSVAEAHAEDDTARM